MDLALNNLQKAIKPNQPANLSFIILLKNPSVSSEYGSVPGF